MRHKPKTSHAMGQRHPEFENELIFEIIYLKKVERNRFQWDLIIQKAVFPSILFSVLHPATLFFRNN